MALLAPAPLPSPSPSPSPLLVPLQLMQLLTLMVEEVQRVPDDSFSSIVVYECHPPIKTSQTSSKLNQNQRKATQTSKKHSC